MKRLFFRILPLACLTLPVFTQPTGSLRLTPGHPGTTFSPDSLRQIPDSPGQQPDTLQRHPDSLRRTSGPTAIPADSLLRPAGPTDRAAAPIPPAPDTADSTAIRPAAVSHDWYPLFGNNLSEAVYDTAAWHRSGGVWTAVREGIIWSRQAYENFELDLEFKTEAGTRSSIVVYCSDTADWANRSVKIRLTDDYDREVAQLPATEQCGAVCGLVAADRQKVVRRPGQWNHLRLRCKGKRIVVILNGKKVTETNRKHWAAGPAAPAGVSRTDDAPDALSGIPTWGYVGLQGKCGNAGIEYRNLRIRNLNGTSLTGR